jgi:hypothetical protein
MMSKSISFLLIMCFSAQILFAAEQPAQPPAKQTPAQQPTTPPAQPPAKQTPVQQPTTPPTQPPAKQTPIQQTTPAQTPPAAQPQPVKQTLPPPVKQPSTPPAATTTAKPVPKTAVKTEMPLSSPASKEKWFWPLVASSGVLFVSSIALYIQAGNYDNKALDAIDSKKKDSYANTTNLYNTLALGCMGGAVICGLYSLKIRFEPAIEPIAQSADGHWNLLVCYHHTF